MLRFFWVFIFALSSLWASAQTDISRNYTITHGLPSNRVYHSMIDSEGFMWFGTEKGVSRYDGYAFENYTTRDGLTDNEVFYLFEDSKRRIWCMTYNGKLSYYYGGQFYNADNAPFLKNAISEAMFSRAYEDKWGNLVFTTSTNGLYVLKGDSFSRYLSGKQFFSPITVNGQLYIASSSSGSSQLYQIQQNGTLKTLDKKEIGDLVSYNWSENDSVYHISLRNAPNDGWGLYSRKFNNLNHVYNTIKTPPNLRPVFTGKIQGTVYIGTNQGLFTYNAKTRLLSKIDVPAENISSLTFDFEGNMWLTTLKNGVYFKPNINIKKYKNISENISKIALNPYTNEIWAGNPAKYYILGETEKREFKLPKTASINETITAYYFFNAHETLIGSDLALSLQKGNTVLELEGGLSGVKNIALNPYNNTMLIASSTSISTLKILPQGRTELKRLIYMRSTSILALDSNIILSGSNNGLYKVDLKKGTKKLLLNERITHIKATKNGDIWMCSDVSGLFLYKNGVFKNFTEKDGLHSNNIVKLVIDKQENVWATTNTGLVKLSYQNNKLNTQNYILSNILGREQVNDVVIVSDTVIVATTAGLYYFIESQLKNSAIKPPLNINNITIQGKKMPLQTYYRLNYKQNNIHIDFTGISFSTRNIIYRYIIQPGNKEWEYTNTKAINLVDLNPGEYSLRLQAIKDGTVNSVEKKLNFTIVAPYYRTLWFYLIVLACIVLVVFFVINMRIKGIRRQASISQTISASKQKALRAQMNPHFLFNSLISIQSFFLNNRNTEGQEYTSKFSKLIRNVLDNSDKEEITIDEEIATLTNYTDLENIRLSNPFIFNVTIDNSVDPYNTYIPTMLLQPIIENAIWHGINYLENKQGIINLIFAQKDTILYITVEDNGVGLKKSAEINTKRNHISKGTTLITDRLEAIGLTRKEKISYTITENPTGGTIVQLTIPIQE